MGEKGKVIQKLLRPQNSILYSLVLLSFVLTLISHVGIFPYLSGLFMGIFSTIMIQRELKRKIGSPLP